MIGRVIGFILLVVELSASVAAQNRAPKVGTRASKQPPSIVVAPPAPPVPSAPPAVGASLLSKIDSTPESLAMASALANRLSPESTTHKVMERTYTQVLPALLQKSPEHSALERAYPGIINALLAAERSVIEPYSIASLPEVRKVMAAVMADYLTAAELSAVKRYYDSPVGTKILDAAADGINLSAIAERNLAGDDTPLSGSDLKGTTTVAAAGLIKRLTQPELAQLTAFGLSPLGRKWQRLQLLILDARAKAENEGGAAIKQQAQDKVAEALQAFIAESDSKKKATP